MADQELWVSLFTAIVGVAIIAIIVSKKAATGGVISAAGNALGTLLAVAVSPVTGASPIQANSVAASGAGPGGGGGGGVQNIASSGAGGFGGFTQALGGFGSAASSIMPLVSAFGGGGGMGGII